MLKVGAGKASLTPTEDMHPFYSLVGECEGIHDEISCRALFIDNGLTKFLWIALELSDQPAVDGFERLISNETGVEANNIIISVTHNHTGPRDLGFGDGPVQLKFRAAFKELEIKAVISAAKDAVANAREARYGYGTINSYINVNRNFQTLKGFWATAPNYGGYSDKTLSIIKFVDLEGKLIAAFLNHPTHATCALELMPLDTARDFDGNRKLSGNFTGYACRFVEEYFGNGAIVLWTSGAAGNQGPILSDMQFQYPDGYTSCVKYPGGVAYQQMEYIGMLHGADAVRGLEAINEYAEDMQIAHASENVFLPAQKCLKTVKGATRMGEIGIRTDYVTPVEYPKLPERIDDPDHPVEMIMQVLKLGDIAIVCAGAELYCEIGTALKQASPYEKTVVVTHTQEVEHVGYVPDKTSVDELCFQNFSTVKPGCSDEIIMKCEENLFAKIK